MTSEPLPPGSVIGIVGGGQLGRMLAQAAAKLGLKASIYAPEPDSPAFDVAAYRHCASYDDIPALEQFAGQADAVTFEFENIPADALAIIERSSILSPPRRALSVTQDRLEERRFLTLLELPVAPFEAVTDGSALAGAVDRLWQRCPETKLFLKRARLGYDGKGQRRISSADEIEEAAAWLGRDSALLECGVNFDFEISVLCVRDRNGTVLFYDPPRNTHLNGVLHESLVPSPLPPEHCPMIFAQVEKIAAELDYVGLLAVEMFAVNTESAFEIVINEIAPRVHNSGHWTLDACAVSQFENHIRAVAGWPLGSTKRHSDVRMVNLLGAEANDWQALLEESQGRSLTLYGKGEPRNGRKMGHFCEIFPQS